jgi:hypothetical protein
MCKQHSEATRSHTLAAHTHNNNNTQTSEQPMHVHLKTSQAANTHQQCIHACKQTRQQSMHVHIKLALATHAHQSRTRLRRQQTVNDTFTNATCTWMRQTCTCSSYTSAMHAHVSTDKPTDAARSQQICTSSSYTSAMPACEQATKKSKTRSQMQPTLSACKQAS